jgi:hypothetical protein
MKFACLAILALASAAGGSMLRIWDTRPTDDSIALGPAAPAVVRQLIRVPVDSELTAIDLGVWPASARPMRVAWDLRRGGEVIARNTMMITDLPAVHPFVIRFDFSTVSLSAGDWLTLTETCFGFNARPWMGGGGLVSAGYGDYDVKPQMSDWMGLLTLGNWDKSQAAEVPQPSAFAMGCAGMAFLLSRRRR